MIKLNQILNNSQNVLIVGHIRPDGDCIGSGLALRRALIKLNFNCDFMCDSPKPYTYDFMPDYEYFNKASLTNYDTMICVDCADKSRLGKYIKYLKLKIVNIDHHVSNTNFGQVNIVKPQTASTCEIIFEILKNENLIDEDTATLLLTGISSDTGHFMHNNVTQHTFLSALELIKINKSMQSVVNGLYKSYSKQRMSLIGRCISNMKFYLQDNVGLVFISLNDLAQCNCTIEDTENIIEYPSSVKGVRVSVCICEQSQNSFKVSLRSRDIDVSAIALHFGGGGHKAAAGCVINGFYQDALDSLLKQITKSLT